MEVKKDVVIDTETDFCTKKAILERCLVMDLSLIIHLLDCESGELKKFVLQGVTTIKYMEYNRITGLWVFVMKPFPIPYNQVIDSYEYERETARGEDDHGKYLKSTHTVIITFGNYSIVFDCYEDEDYHAE